MTGLFLLSCLFASPPPCHPPPAPLPLEPLFLGSPAITWQDSWDDTYRVNHQTWEAAKLPEAALRRNLAVLLQKMLERFPAGPSQRLFAFQNLADHHSALGYRNHSFAYLGRIIEEFPGETEVVV